MLLHEKIKEQIQESMKAGDKVRLEVMRGLVTAFTNELVSTKRTPQDLLTDDQAMAVIQRSAKQRKDSIEQFIKGGRMDLVEEEIAQLKILEEYLPKLMSQEEVEEFVKIKITEMGDIDMTQKGILMSILMKDLKGRAGGNMVRVVVDQLYK